MTPGYYIPRVTIPSQWTLVVGYHTFKLIIILNPTTTYSTLEHNQFLHQLEQLHNLKQRPSHQCNFQPHAKPMEIVLIYVVVRQTQPLNQIICPNVPIMRIVERPHI